ncbi:MAG: hypothetical protein Q9183_006384 [Haloplaca sp. 2 TL-2023]
MLRRRGGNCPNSLEVLQQLLGVDTSSPSLSLALLSVLPSKSSAAYQEIQSSLNRTTSLEYCIHREECKEVASSYIIRSLEADTRTIINYNGLEEMTVDEFAAVADGMGEELGWCHFEGRIPDVTLACMQHLCHHHPSIKISVELEKPTREGLQDCAAIADVVFYSQLWAKGKGYSTAKHCLEDQATKTPKATVGAGDTFIASMLFALTCRGGEWNYYSCLAFANEVAGRKVVQEGFGGLGEGMRYLLGQTPPMDV